MVLGLLEIKLTKLILTNHILFAFGVDCLIKIHHLTGLINCGCIMKNVKNRVLHKPVGLDSIKYHEYICLFINKSELKQIFLNKNKLASIELKDKQIKPKLHLSSSIKVVMSLVWVEKTYKIFKYLARLSSFGAIYLS